MAHHHGFAQQPAESDISGPREGDLAQQPAESDIFGPRENDFAQQPAESDTFGYSKRSRPRRTAAQRRAQQLRADSRFLQRAMKGLMEIDSHRGNTLSLAGEFLMDTLKRMRSTERFPRRPDGVDGNAQQPTEFDPRTRREGSFAQQSADRRGMRHNMPICRHYVNNRCSWGNACKFKHDGLAEFAKQDDLGETTPSQPRQHAQQQLVLERLVEQPAEHLLQEQLVLEQLAEQQLVTQPVVHLEPPQPPTAEPTLVTALPRFGDSDWSSLAFIHAEPQHLDPQTQVLEKLVPVPQVERQAPHVQLVQQRDEPVEEQRAPSHLDYRPNLKEHPDLVLTRDGPEALEIWRRALQARKAHLIALKTLRSTQLASSTAITTPLDEQPVDSTQQLERAAQEPLVVQQTEPAHRRQLAPLVEQRVMQFDSISSDTISGTTRVGSGSNPAPMQGGSISEPMSYGTSAPDAPYATPKKHVTRRGPIGAAPSKSDGGYRKKT